MTAMYPATPSPGADHELRVHADRTGCLWYEPGPDEAQRPTTPMEYLALALGGCLLFFARRFFSRRGMDEDPDIHLCWQVDTQGLHITTMTVTISTATPLEEGEQTTLRRMLDQCPIHRALSAVPITIQLDAG
jgi:uncharacterized OsmC-like protein